MTRSEMAERASQTWITFTDKADRELVAEIIETSEDSLKIRRQADGRVFNLPIEMLSKSDQAFVTYIKNPEVATTEKSTRQAGSNEQAIMDQLFN